MRTLATVAALFACVLSSGDGAAMLDSDFVIQTEDTLNPDGTPPHCDACFQCMDACTYEAFEGATNCTRDVISYVQSACVVDPSCQRFETLRDTHQKTKNSTHLQIVEELQLVHLHTRHLWFAYAACQDGPPLVKCIQAKERCWLQDSDCREVHRCAANSTAGCYDEIMEACYVGCDKKRKECFESNIEGHRLKMRGGPTQGQEGGGHRDECNSLHNTCMGACDTNEKIIEEHKECVSAGVEACEAAAEEEVAGRHRAMTLQCEAAEVHAASLSKARKELLYPCQEDSCLADREICPDECVMTYQIGASSDPYQGDWWHTAEQKIAHKAALADSVSYQQDDVYVEMGGLSAAAEVVTASGSSAGGPPVAAASRQPPKSVDAASASAATTGMNSNGHDRTKMEL